MSINISIKSLFFNLMFCCCLLGISLSLAAQDKALVGSRLIDGFGHQPIANSVILIKMG
jgi:hypothetical protein